MTLTRLFAEATDNQKLCINADGRRYSGYWYQDHMLDLHSRYKYHSADITVKTPELIVATIRRW